MVAFFMLKFKRFVQNKKFDCHLIKTGIVYF